MKEMLLQNWNFMRILKLAIGVWAIISAIQTSEPLVGLMGVALTLMAITNTGSCGAAGCSAPREINQNQVEKTEEVSYEEIT
jgi:hypothetical protein